MEHKTRVIGVDHVYNILDEHGIKWDAGFVLAISGGVDSMVLFDIMSVPVFRQVVAHVNYNLRSDSHKEVQLLQAMCDDADNLELRVLEVPKSHWENFKGNVQVEARRLRYEFFEQLKTEYRLEYIITAHHADDALESFFINLLRGSGLAGITGWEVVKENRIRPLLDFTKKEILEYAKNCKLQWFEDNTNSTPKYMRNRLRNEALPLLMDIDPRQGAGLHRTIKHMRTAQNALNWAYDFWKQHQVEVISDGFSIKWASEKEQYFVARFLSDYVYIHPDELFNFMYWTHSNVAITIGECKLQRISHGVLLFPNYRLAPPIDIELVKYSMGYNGTYVHFDFWTDEFMTHLYDKYPFHEHPKDTLFLDADLLPDTMRLRSITPEDRFQPLGMEGTKRVTDFLSDRKVGHMEKQKSLVLWAHQKIAAVLPHQIDNAFRVTPESRNILVITKNLSYTK